MAPSLVVESITPAEFQEALSRYDLVVQSVSKPSNKDGETLEQLDAYRLSTVPARLAKVREEGGELYLEKEEVERLIRWKLKHGKFRPSLLGLVSSNTESQIRAATVSGFALLSQDTAVKTGVLPALDKLTVLKGIGPASASLLLSVCRPESVPFFSDEAFRWVMTGVDYSNNAGGKGWGRNIKYDKKEYGEFIRRVQGLIERLGGDVKAVDVERVGWVLGREKAVIQGELGSASKETSKPAKVGKETKTSAKRKAGDTTGAVANSEAAGGSRRSKRLRK